jgi:hypothetical protein
MSSDQSTLHLQLQQAFEGFRFQIGLLVQFWGFLIAIDALFIGYAFSEGKALFLLLGTAVPVIMVVAGWGVLAYSAPYALAAVRLERRLLSAGDGVMGTYLRMRFPAMYRNITAVVDSEGEVEATLRYPPVNRGMLLMVVVDVAFHLGLFGLALIMFDGRFV